LIYLYLNKKLNLYYSIMENSILFKTKDEQISVCKAFRNMIEIELEGI
jgi:hypothetical protein